MLKNVKKKHTLYYTEDQIFEMKKISSELGISMSDLIRLAIKDFIKKYEIENKKGE